MDLKISRVRGHVHKYPLYYFAAKDSIAHYEGHFFLKDDEIEIVYA